jgi:hypothetical protein
MIAYLNKRIRLYGFSTRYSVVTYVAGSSQILNAVRSHLASVSTNRQANRSDVTPGVCNRIILPLDFDLLVLGTRYQCWSSRSQDHTLKLTQYGLGHFLLHKHW